MSRRMMRGGGLVGEGRGDGRMGKKMAFAARALDGSRETVSWFLEGIS